MNQGNNARRLLESIFAAGVARVDPAGLVREHLIESAGSLQVRIGTKRTVRFDARRIWLVAAGKAAPAMAAEASRIVGAKLAAGVVAGPRRPRRFLPRVLTVFSAGHPLPNSASLAAGRAVWRMLASARAKDGVLLLLSGGASSHVVLPAAGIRLHDKIRTSELLLGSGATIAEINAVRKHLSRLKGGGLARRAGRARVVCLYLSDAIGGSPA
ncbi:MAG: DUF4147 domain-containing protein, partial [Candidatus Binatia bacterium]